MISDSLKGPATILGLGKSVAVSIRYSLILTDYVYFYVCLFVLDRRLYPPTEMYSTKIQY